MSITVKLYEIAAARPALERLGREKLPVKAAYRLQKAVRRVEQENREYDAAQIGLVRRHARESVWEIPREKQAEFEPVYQAFAERYPEKPDDLDRFIEAEEALLEQYGRKSAVKQLRIYPWELQALNDEMAELAESETELEIHPIPINLLGNLQLPARDMAATWFLWLDEEEMPA